MHANQDSLSRRLGPVFAEVAALAARGDKPGLARATEMAAANPQIAAIKVPAKAYKPAHGGYPGTPVMRNPQPF